MSATPSGRSSGSTLAPTALGDDQSAADELDADLGSGFLTDSSRAAALAAALPFVATYFVRSDDLQLRPAAVLGARPAAVAGRVFPIDDLVLIALRLRAALFAGRQLAEILRAVLRNANFRYELVRDEHVGHLHGRLDVPRYLQARGRRAVPRRYPVVDAQRSSATPENVLAAFALRWLVADLDACLLRLRLPADTPEARAAEQVRADLVRLDTHPILRRATTDAAAVTRRETVGRLLDTVEARIRAGHVTRAGGYERLTGWVRRAVADEPLAEPGDLAADFYGPGFDEKLFELWCLAQLAAALTRLLGPERHRAPHHLVRDTQTPLFVWEAGADMVELYFQPSLDTLTGAPNRWRYQPSGHRLRGYPDLGIRCRHVDGSAEVVLLDAKLRRRTSAHGQEIYKLLGYVANAGSPVRFGGLIFHEPHGFHGPDGEHHTELERDPTDDPGHLDLIAVDPGDTTGSVDAFAILARLVVTATGVPAEQVAAVATAGDDDPDASETERNASRAQAIAVAQLQTMAGQLPQAMLDTTAANLRALLEGSWQRLGDGVQRMVISAVHFGVTAPEGADLAGPVLGLCSPLERLLRDRLAAPALASILNRRGCDPARWTLGTLLARLDEALRNPAGPVTRALERHITAREIDPQLLLPLIDELDHLRSRHRNKAAHQGLIERSQWGEVYRLVLRADRALLPRLVTLLPGNETTALPNPGGLHP